MDIFEFAMEKERHAEKYYRDLAQRAEHDGLKHILTMLADEEAGHLKSVQQMKRQSPPTVTASPVLNSAKEMFSKMKASAETFSFDISEADLYQKAADIEQQSKTYYLAKADEVEDADQKAIFKRLAEEENKHLVLVQNIADFVSRPETYLEDAEFTHFDDYADGEF